jgi:ATP-dependent protease ClpP protease subunit
MYSEHGQHQDANQLQYHGHPISAPMARIELEPRSEHISALFAAPVTSEGIYSLCNRIEEAINYYRYESIELFLHSPGGSAAALKHFIACSQRWARRDIKLRTVALNETSSAAAFMLSSGTLGERTVQAHSRLVYHFSRLSAGEVFAQMNRQSEGQLTARRSHKAAADLRALERLISREDEFLLGQLCRHIFGDVRADPGSGRWASEELPTRLGRVGKWLSHHAPKRSQGASAGDVDLTELRGAATRLGRETKSCEMLAERAILEIRRVFERDEPIHPVMAYLLLLIDRIEGFDEVEQIDAAPANS